MEPESVDTCIATSIHHKIIIADAELLRVSVVSSSISKYLKLRLGSLLAIKWEDCTKRLFKLREGVKLKVVWGDKLTSLQGERALIDE
jgi:hypothetical protein